MNTNETHTETVNRMNNLAVETTQTLVDAAYLAQKQSAQLLQAWMGTLDAGQKTQRDLASKLVQQAQEAQTLLQQYVQQTFQAGVGNFNQAAQAGFQQASNNVNSATQNASTASKRTEANAK